MNVILPGTWIVLVLILFIFQWLFSRHDRVFLTFFISFITAIIVIFYFVFPALTLQDIPEEWKYFDFHFKDTLERIEGLLKKKGIPHATAPIDEQWFNGEQERLGIDREILSFHRLDSTVFELNGGNQRIMVSNVPGDGGRRSFVSVWLKSREDIQFLDALKADIDAALSSHPQ